MPANPVKGCDGRLLSEVDIKCGALDGVAVGETKREKAFWQVYSSMLGHTQSEVNSKGEFDSIAKDAIDAVNAGFKALENNDV